jgi:hypothetical protein
LSSETTVGREPLQIVEIEQPACVETYGSSPCTAALGTTGTRKCYNTNRTCQDLDNYDASFTIFWRFALRHAVLPRDLYDSSAGVYVKTNPIPSLRSVSSVPTKLNIGGGGDSSSPLGTRSMVTIQLDDILWDDSVGDFYVDERPDGTAGDAFNPIDNGTFWTTFKARNPYYAGYIVRIYDGYHGQALGSMQKREYILERIDGPTNDRVTLTAKDPLRLADDKRAEFPKPSEIELISNISSTTQTAGIEVACVESELTDAFGNTGTDYYLRIEDEIIKYTGYANSGTNEWTLNSSGLARGALGTTAATHDGSVDPEKCQRVGRYDSLEVWNIVEDLLENHTSLDSSLINDTQWDTEGNAYLSPFVLDGTVAEPTPVIELIGELTEQCPFYIWWDERAQTIPLKAVRPPLGDAVEEITDETSIIAGTTSLKVNDEQRISRVIMYYQLKDPTKPEDNTGNYRKIQVQIDADAESSDQYNESRIRSIFSRWIQTSAQALQTTVRLLSRLRDAVETLEFRVDAKDRDIATADVLLVTTREVTDERGVSTPQQWQVIAAEEIVSGEVMRYSCQRFEFLGRFMLWADNAAPDYSAATDVQKEENGYWSDANGSPGSNEPGYQWV